MPCRTLHHHFAPCTRKTGCDPAALQLYGKVSQPQQFEELTLMLLKYSLASAIVEVPRPTPTRLNNSREMFTEHGLCSTSSANHVHCCFLPSTSRTPGTIRAVMLTSRREAPKAESTSLSLWLLWGGYASYAPVFLGSSSCIQLGFEKFNGVRIVGLPFRGLS